MKIVMLIDYLGSGGAQRQLFMLAKLFREKGAEVEVLTFFEADFFLPMFQDVDVPVVNVASRGRMHRIIAVRRAIRNRGSDLVISFLKTPNMLAELAGLPRRSFKIVVSERNNDIVAPPPIRRLQLFLHRLADAVVVNSQAQHRFLLGHAPWLREKLHVICNCVDLDQFHPQGQPLSSEDGVLRILVLARIHPQKNPFALVDALALLKRTRPELDIRVDWYGEHIFIFDEKIPNRDGYLRQLEEFIRERGLQDQFRLHRPDREVLDLYRRADVFCLPSFHEGCSNVLGEAMACGLPVLASRAGDNDRLVADAENGFLFDAGSAKQLAAAISRFCALGHQEKIAMGQCSRRRAERILSPERFIREYIQLSQQLV